jgi:hypothetical protein
MSPRCEFFVAVRRYSKPGRCETPHNVKPVSITEGHDKVRVHLCSPHRKLVAEGRPLRIAR